MFIFKSQQKKIQTLSFQLLRAALKRISNNFFDKVIAKLIYKTKIRMLDQCNALFHAFRSRSKRKISKEDALAFY